MDASKIGIYLNPAEKQVVRITSPYWLPEEPDWLLVTNEPNATLLAIREAIQDKKLLPDASDVVWGSIPLKE